MGEKNKELSTKGNIRDYASIIELIILNNLEVVNSELIKLGINQRDRLIKLNESARNHMNVINNNHLNNNYLSDK